MGRADCLLALESVRGGYGASDVLRGVDLGIDAQSIVVVIGANGAGKSTLLKAVFGALTLTGGRVVFDGEDITGLSTRERMKRGILLVPQGRCNFPLMSVQENLEMGAYLRTDNDVQRDIDLLYERFPVLGEKSNVLAGNLSGGEQQLLEMSMAMMLRPRLILLDEPSLGLSSAMQRLVFGSIEQLRGAGATVLLVEQNAVQALTIADVGIVIELGRVTHRGNSAAMLEDPDVRRAYLGLS